jgi:hypothetical protein
MMRLVPVNSIVQQRFRFGRYEFITHFVACCLDEVRPCNDAEDH